MAPSGPPVTKSAGGAADRVSAPAVEQSGRIVAGMLRRGHGVHEVALLADLVHLALQAVEDVGSGLRFPSRATASMTSLKAAPA